MPVQFQGPAGQPPFIVHQAGPPFVPGPGFQPGLAGPGPVQVLVRGPAPPQGMPVPQPQPPAAQNVAGQQLDVKLAAQQGDIQQLLMENQRLAATHVALRQELASAQGEIQRLKGAVGEKDQVVRGLMDTKAKLEADLRGADTLRQELQAARQELQGTRGEIQALTSRRQAEEAARMAQHQQHQQQQQQLQQQQAQMQQQQAKIQQQAAQIGQMNQDLNRMHADVQLLPKLRGEIDSITQELALAR
ncbi:unnamed protein product [Closterium sp. Naga37s-1]|nr:unnamed protein product [Closterium sp. Naga37s-1]